MMIEPFKLKEAKMDDALLPETLDPENWDDMRALAFLLQVAFPMQLQAL